MENQAEATQWCLLESVKSLKPTNGHGNFPDYFYGIGTTNPSNWLPVDTTKEKTRTWQRVLSGQGSVSHLSALWEVDKYWES